MNDFNEVFIEDELTSSYLSYAMSVIVGRALPDVRDGLKPVHRRILFVMREINNTFDKGYKKSARIVGEVIGKYHPHGEIAVYDSIVRLAQPFVQRYVLIDGQGNFGSIDGDSPAAMRYTEIKMSEISDFLLKDLECDVVDFVDNYDNTERQPVILPSMIPNLLINGACGIAVGMATNIPPHNLKEVINACLFFLSKNDADNEDLMEFILAPDFPTYGIIPNFDEIKNIYKCGKGKFFLRANFFIEKNDTLNDVIIITELPYQVNKSKLLESFEHLINVNELEHIKTIRDESDKNGLRICIEVEKDKNINAIINNLFLKTKLQISYNVNMVALVDNNPKLLNLKDMIMHFLNHRKEVVYRRSKFRLLKAENKLHLLEALCLVILNLKIFIDIIIDSDNFSDIKNLFNSVKINLDVNNSLCNNVKNKLISSSYSFSDLQIQAILDMKISKLTKLEKNKLFLEYDQILNDINFYTNIIVDSLFLDSIVKEELIFIRDKFGDDRRTKIELIENKVLFNNLVKKEKEIIIITLSINCYIKAQLLSNYIAQHRGGKGKSGTSLKVSDCISNFLICDTYDILLCFSTCGKVYWIMLYNFLLSDRLSRGVPIINLIPLIKLERISSMLAIKDYYVKKFLFMVTKNGMIKKILLTDLKNQRSNGLGVIDLLDNDLLVDVKIVDINDDIIIFTKKSKAVRFFVKDIRCSSRSARGVIGITLLKDDCVVSFVVLEKNCFILTASENGYGKRTNIIEFGVTKRGNKGVIAMKVDKITGDLTKVEKVFNTNDLLLVTSSGIISRIRVNDIPCRSRSSKGVHLINLTEKEKLVDIKSIY